MKNDKELNYIKLKKENKANSKFVSVALFLSVCVCVHHLGVKQKLKK